MGELFMYAGILTAIILCFVGIAKLPFAKFKANKPKLYKATFTLLSIILSIVACIIAQLYILEDVLISTNFVVLLLSTMAGVFGLYSSYEGLQLKTLVKTIINKLQELRGKAPESKFAKLVEKIGIDKAEEFIAMKKEEKGKEKVVEIPVETIVVESSVPAEEPTTTTETNF